MSISGSRLQRSLLRPLQYDHWHQRGLILWKVIKRATSKKLSVFGSFKHWYFIIWSSKRTIFARKYYSLRIESPQTRSLPSLVKILFDDSQLFLSSYVMSDRFLDTPHWLSLLCHGINKVWRFASLVIGNVLVNFYAVIFQVDQRKIWLKYLIILIRLCQKKWSIVSLSFFKA